MATDLFSYIELYRRIVHTTGHVLAKGAAFAESQGVSSDDMLDWRLIDDMQPLRFQVAVVCNFTKQYAARVAGIAVPGDVDADWTSPVSGRRRLRATLAARRPRSSPAATTSRSP